MTGARFRLRCGARWIAVALALGGFGLAAAAAAQTPPAVTVYHSADPEGVDPRVPTCPPGCTCSGSGEGSEPFQLLASTGSRGAALISIDPATGAGTLIGPLNSFGPITEIGFTDEGVLLGTTGGGNRNAVVIDPATGFETFFGQHDDFGAITAAAGVGEVAYVAFIEDGGGSAPSTLRTGDIGSPALPIVGLTGFGPIGGLAWDPQAEILYGATAGSGGGDLISLDLATGAGTLVGPTGFGDIGALEFGPDGTLYGGLGGNAENAGSLITIDPATGAGTLIGPSGYPAISGFAGVGGGGSSVQCVLAGRQEEALALWIDGGPTPTSGGELRCNLGNLGGSGDELCGAMLFFQITGPGFFTDFLEDSGPGATIDTLVHDPGCESEEGCPLPAGTKQLRMNFVRGGSGPPTGPRFLGTLVVDSRNSTPEMPTRVTVFGTAAGANLSLRPIASSGVPELVAISVPEPGGVLQLLSGLMGLGFLMRLRRWR